MRGMSYQGGTRAGSSQGAGGSPGDFDATLLLGGSAAFAFSDEKIAWKRRGCLLFLLYVILFSTAGST